MRIKKDKFTDILRRAEAEGLSYGKYVALYLDKPQGAHRKPIPKDHISINDRKRLKIGMPIYCGASTLAAALWTDCPRSAYKLTKDVHIDAPDHADTKPHIEEPPPDLGETIIDLYKNHYTVDGIQRTLHCPRGEVVRVLREADIEMRGSRPPIPVEKIEEMKALRAAGYSYYRISKECGVSVPTVGKYLKSE